MAEGDDSAWDNLVKEWLIDSGQCSAGGLANEEYAVYAAAADDDDGWSKLYKEDHEEEFAAGDDGSIVEKVTICEADTIKQAITKDTECPRGMWLGGHKFRKVRWENFDFNDCKFDTAFCAKNKGGCHLIKTEQGTTVLAIYDEDKEQTAGNAKGVALQFAEHLSTTGY